jgi:two-component system, NarL family, response regulator LiaR
LFHVRLVWETLVTSARFVTVLDRGSVKLVQPISVLVVDDHRVFAGALRARLSTEPELGPVSVAYNAADAEARLTGMPVDVTILDYVLEDGTGTALAERLRHSAPHTRVIMLSAVRSVEPVAEALAAGVRAWLPKSVDTSHLIRVIIGVHAGEMWVDPALLGAVLPELLARVSSSALDVLAVLTQREREVLDCMIEGLSRAEIASRLRVSGNTVRTHTQNLIVKLGVHSSLEAVTMALRAPHHT